ncbi:DUF5993 family protein [Photorhabdus tasmaniensis]|uniref:Uncharacterized protein n=3 Tax=Morganellaceae TaxID=1903414 RepID=A0A081S018_PHOTE|nr:DUF5993 family protein [Photorhabdus temperata]EQB98614.1 hypothetical protein B738_23578 [Photorhabdus temperata subsp. temperata M1021]ERT14367.1 hypothetical protein O185_03940 [Photorhabdus temperata J3]KER04271.1 hypothetical protein MEG1DRAFT_01041 [Photorhabdus temperata subsp. temperata Meg1]
MYMFLPFLIALFAVITTLVGKNKTSYALWGLLLVTTIAWFIHHATDSLNLSF